MIPTDETADLPPADAAEQLLDAAESQGALKPIEAALKAEGATLSARDCIKFAQFDDRTKGKTPDELAKMISEDPSLIQDIEGEKEKRESSEPAAEGPEPKESPEMMMQSRMKKAKAEELPPE